MARNNTQKPKVKINLQLILVLVALVLGGMYIYALQDKMGVGLIGSSGSGASFAPSGIELNYEYSASLNCYANSNGFFFCTKDGIKFISVTGDIKWDYPLSMSQPVMAGEGAYAAVGDGNGKVLYVFSEEGLAYTHEFDVSETINSFAINPMGYASVIFQNEENYKVRVLDNRGGRIMDQIYTDDNIFPFATDISDDSRMVAVGLLKLGGLAMSSDINFHYLNDGEKDNYSDGMFGSVTSYDGQLVAKVKFMADNMLLTISDTHVSGISTANHTLAKVFDHEIGNEIDFVAFPNGTAFVLAAGEPVVNKESFEEGDLLFFNMSGDLISLYSAGSKVTALSGGAGAVLAGYGNMGRTFTAFNDRGSLQWHYTVSQDVSQMHFFGKTDRIIFISPLKLQVLERSKSPARQINPIMDEMPDDMDETNPIPTEGEAIEPTGPETPPSETFPPEALPDLETEPETQSE